jgi:hypothetical protein
MRKYAASARADEPQPGRAPATGLVVCNACGLPHKRARFRRATPLGRDAYWIYIAEDGRQWNGLRCPDCVDKARRGLLDAVPPTPTQAPSAVGEPVTCSKCNLPKMRFPEDRPGRFGKWRAADGRAWKGCVCPDCVLAQVSAVRKDREAKAKAKRLRQIAIATVGAARAASPTGQPQPLITTGKRTCRVCAQELVCIAKPAGLAPQDRNAPGPGLPLWLYVDGTGSRWVGGTCPECAQRQRAARQAEIAAQGVDTPA